MLRFLLNSLHHILLFTDVNMGKARHKSCEALVILFCISELLVVGLLMFSHGFLLTRQVISTNSSCVDFKELNPDHRAAAAAASTLGKREGCWMVPSFKKSIILLIDALRYDFALYNTSLKEGEALPYQNKMPVFWEITKQHPHKARLTPFLADAPTTTMQRLMGLTTGSLPTFIDASHNFARYVSLSFIPCRLSGFLQCPDVFVPPSV